MTAPAGVADPYLPASAAAVDRLAREIAGIRAAQKAASTTPSLTHSAIDDGALVTTVGGQLATVIGQQFDGTSGAVVVSGPTPPTPAPPEVTTKPGGFNVRWNGQFSYTSVMAPVVAPSDFKGVEVQVSTDINFTNAQGANAFNAVVGTLITSARGGDVFVPWTDEATPIYARLVTRTLPGKASVPSAPVGPILLMDTTPPGQPSTPAVSSWLGQVKVVWDGNLAGGIPKDFLRVDVHVAAASNFVPSDGNRVGSLVSGGAAYASSAYGTNVYVQLVAYDNTGNASVPSAVAGPVAAAKVVSDDILAGAVGSQQLADLAVVNAKIGLLAVNDANIGNLSVGKLVAGTLNADVIVGGRIATALTGARTEMNSLGFQKFSPDGNKVISLTANESLLSGEFKTALTGRRIEFGSQGSEGLIEFIAPDGQTGFIKGYTEPDARQIESIQIGLDVGGHYLWNRININDREEIRMDAAQINLHFATNATQFGRFSVNSYDSKASTGTGYRNRFVVDENGIGWWDQNGTKIGDIVAGAWRFFGNSQGGSVDFVSNLGQSSQSVRMSMWQPNGGGVTVKAWAGGLESRNIGDTLFAPVVASAFTVGSDRRWKTDIADADLDSRAVLGAMRVRKYRVRVPNRDDDGYHEVEQIGLVAQEAPPMLVPEGRSDGTLGIDLYQQINVLTLALQRGFVLVDDLVRRVAALEARRP